MVQAMHSFIATNCSTLCLKNNALLYSNDVIIIAQPGAILIKRGTMPAYSPRIPFSRSIFDNISNVPAFGNDDTFSPNSICRCVFTTSNGAVTMAAICKKLKGKENWKSGIRKTHRHSRSQLLLHHQMKTKMWVWTHYFEL